MKSIIKTAISLLLILALLSAPSAFAEESGTETPDSAVESSIIDNAVLTKAVEDLMTAHGLSSDRMKDVSFAYTYLATGDSWYYNGDVWRYPGSMYKVPMMMVLAEREAAGELSRDSDLGGYTLGKAEELILVHSNNDYAHRIRKYLGGDTEARKLYQKYSPQEPSYYHSDFIDYCYFTARYMDDVMQTLYNDPDKFPNIIECLKLAMPGEFFRGKLDPSIEVAQKYGTFEEFNANTGIIYLENPIILTVMTENLSYEKAESMMSDAALIFAQYSLGLDAQLEQYETELAEARRIAEEEKRLAEEKAEAERKAAEEEKARIEAEKKAEEERIRQEAEKKARREALIRKLSIIGGAVLAAVIIVLIISKHIAKKRRSRELARRKELERRRRYRMELDDEAYYVSRGRDDYRPRH